MKLRIKSLIKGTLLRVYILRLRIATWLARLAGKKIIFILGTPWHPNLGDQAIALAETEFIKSNLPGVRVIAVPKPIMLQKKVDFLPGLVCEQDVIIGHGGGNWGDVYASEELCRRMFIELFPSNKIIIFPQTIHFTNTEQGRVQLANSRAIYGKHQNLTLFAREQTSYKTIKQTFTKNKILLTPDIVLSTNQSKPNIPRNGLLLCFRADQEAKLNAQDKKVVANFTKKHFKSVKYTDTVSTKKYFFARSKNAQVQNKLNEFRSARLVITDRLHGMVFSVITGTPCIALDNFNHKVKDTYGWISYLPYIKFCKNTNQLETLFKQLNLNKTYSYNPEHFNSYWAQINNELLADGE